MPSLDPRGRPRFFFLSSQLADRFHKDRESEWGQLGCQCTISPTSERWRSSETHSNKIINDKHKREHNEKEKNENENEKTRALIKPEGYTRYPHQGQCCELAGYSPIGLPSLQAQVLWPGTHAI